MDGQSPTGTNKLIKLQDEQNAKDEARMFGDGNAPEKANLDALANAYLPHSGSTVSGRPEYVAQAVKIDRDLAAQERAWIDQLRAEGIKAAHPDDGWVDRDKNRVHLCYPQFDDGLAVGDRLALGTTRSWRVVTITGSREATPIMRPAWPESRGTFWWYFDASASRKDDHICT